MCSIVFVFKIPFLSQEKKQMQQPGQKRADVRVWMHRMLGVKLIFKFILFFPVHFDVSCCVHQTKPIQIYVYAFHYRFDLDRWMFRWWWLLMHIVLCHLFGWHCQLHPIYSWHSCASCFWCMCFCVVIHSFLLSLRSVVVFSTHFRSLVRPFALCISHSILKWALRDTNRSVQ